MAARKNTATPTTVTAEQRVAILEELYNVEYGCASLRTLITELRATSAVPLEGDSGVELGVTMGALTDAIAAAADRLYLALNPEESEAAHG